MNGDHLRQAGLNTSSALNLRSADDPSCRSLFSIAIIIPCFNEEVAIPHVVAAFQRALPGAAIFVYDNNSTDQTAMVASVAGAAVRRETLQGKGNVIRRAFADVEADVYVLVDGDDTYDAAAAGAMVDLLCQEQLDMVTGVRRAISAGAYRAGHRLGNRMLTGIVHSVFGDRISDVLSGYRVFSRRFVKSFPALATGFETEVEFTIHALDLQMPVGELVTDYRERPEGSGSKLRTFRDGVRILNAILVLVKEERPLSFFSLCGAVLLLAGLAVGIPVMLEFLQTHLVLRLPSAVLATGLVLLSFACLFCGLILDSVMRGRKEAKRLAYLAIPGIAADAGPLVSMPIPRSAD